MLLRCWCWGARCSCTAGGECDVGVLRRCQPSHHLFSKAKQEISRGLMTVFLRSWHRGSFVLPQGHETTPGDPHNSYEGFVKYVRLREHTKGGGEEGAGQGRTAPHLATRPHLRAANTPGIRYNTSAMRLSLSPPKHRPFMAAAAPEALPGRRAAPRHNSYRPRGEPHHKVDFLRGELSVTRGEPNLHPVSSFPSRPTLFPLPTSPLITARPTDRLTARLTILPHSHPHLPSPRPHPSHQDRQAGTVTLSLLMPHRATYIRSGNAGDAATF